MWRVLVFLAVLAAAAAGAVWLAEQGGNLALTWAGNVYRVDLVTAAVALIAGAFALLLGWTLARFVWRVPDRISLSAWRRRRDRGLRALSRGMIAVGAGDAGAAQRHAGEARRLLGREPLTLLLQAQAAQIAGDRATAESAFRSMAETPETRVLGLRGLYVEARRRGDRTAAIAHASEAARLAPAVGWANEAVLEGQCADGDWRAALATVERRASLGLLDKETARRQRAVLLAADAVARAEHDEAGALAGAQEAVRLAPDLVPAAALAGRILAGRGDLRRATRILEAAWKATPHPDLADAYLRVRAGDAPHDRLKRAERLAALSSWAPEGRLALARTAIEAREYDRARQTLQPLLEGRPTVRACLLMADLERAEHGPTGRTREWISRAAHAPRDSAWIADGMVSDRWSPISPVSGRLDAFEWRQPPDLIAGSGAMLLDESFSDRETSEPIPIPPPAPRPAEPASRPAEPPSRPAEAAPREAGTPEPVSAAATASDVAAESIPAPSVSSAPAETVEAGTPQPSASEPVPANGVGPKAHANGADEAHPVASPVGQAPDDPGPRSEKDKTSRFRLFH